MNTACEKEEMVKIIVKTKKIVEERGYGLYDDEAEGLAVSVSLFAFPYTTASLFLLKQIRPFLDGY